MASVAIALVVWRHLKNDTGPSSPKAMAEKARKRRSLAEGRN
jgi:hypothetical protein